MKYLFIAAFITVTLSCNQPAENSTSENTEVTENYSYFGDTINPEGAIPLSQLTKMLKDKDTVRVKVIGTIEEVCQKKGCWMTMELNEEESMRVSFRDYEYFVPKNAAGREAILEGIAYKHITTVAELRHYAEDAGESEEEIESITEDEVEISFEADGVIIKE